jgi:acetyl esterase/lipase
VLEVSFSINRNVHIREPIVMNTASPRFSVNVLCALGFVLGLGVNAVTALAADQPRIRPDIVYGHKDGLALTFDAISPEKPNGAGVLWLQSGGWYSGWNDPQKLLPACQPFLEKGFTVFIVRHGSAPKYAVPDAIADVRRCVRYLHLHGNEFQVDPARLGVYGGSAGGHLSLMLGTTADAGDPKSKDEVLRQSDRVAAVVAYYPPTDISTWVTDPPAAIKAHPGLKPPLTFDAALAPACSPLLYVSADDAPTLLVHGDQDQLVPIEHSHNYVAAAKEKQLPCTLLVMEGAGHGFNGKQGAEAMAAMLAWFEKTLNPTEKAETTPSSN